MSSITSLSDDALIAFDNLQDIAGSVLDPTIRLGITGLSRAGKTVFISSLIHNLTQGGQLTMFEAQASGRISHAELRPQPSMNLPRFEYEKHIDTLINDQLWPESTRAISELRLTIHYESASGWNRTFGRGTLNVDIVDYPGEWLLDLPLLGLTYEQWSKQAVSLSNLGNRKPLAKQWHALLKNVDIMAKADEMQIKAMSDAFTEYLRGCKEDKTALSTLPPGRFLLPGDLEGSPALTFAPLDLDSDFPAAQSVPKDRLIKVMEARFEAYKSVVIKPFFREHFARLDRQIVLVDALQAINAGPAALSDLETALVGILECFKTGKNTLVSSLFARRIDKILFAATKADHLHHENHDRLQAILSRIVDNASKRAKFSGAEVDVLAIASVRATNEANVKDGKDELPVIVGHPLKGEAIGDEVFDGKRSTAIFPGDLPKDVNQLFDVNSKNFPELNFVRFRPPTITKAKDGVSMTLPHIRMDRALEFLLGDSLA